MKINNYYYIGSNLQKMNFFLYQTILKILKFKIYQIISILISEKAEIIIVI